MTAGPVRALIPLIALPALLALPCAGAAVQSPPGAAAGTALSGPEPVDGAWVDRVLRRLTLRQRVAQLVMPYIDGGRPSRAQRERAELLVRELGVGGLIVGVGSGWDTAAFLNALQRESAVPLLVAADLEWGPGTRLRGATTLPMNMALAAAGGPELAREAGRITALEARAAGVHVAFAPVADVNNNPLNPVINTRSYGSDAGAVSARVSGFIEGARSAGLLTVAKHFPGHGDTDTDSHLRVPVVRVDRARLDAVELAPFRAAIAAGVDGVMSAHLTVPSLQPGEGSRPATLSRAVMTELLRGELGFRGLVVTDGLHMDAVKRRGSPGAVAVAALKAGADVLLQPPDPVRAVDAVVAAVARGELSAARIDASVRRVLAAKSAAGLPTRRNVPLETLLATVGRAEHAAWGRRVLERSLTLVRAPERGLPRTLAGVKVAVIRYDDGRKSDAGDVFDAGLAARGADVESVRLWRRSGWRDVRAARRAAADAELVIVASYARARAWKGRLALPRRVAALAEELAADGALLVSFGDPYVLRQAPSASTYLLAWTGDGAAQRAAVRALAGEIPVTGRLPIALPGGHGPGAGVLVLRGPDAAPAAATSSAPAGTRR